MNWQLITKEGLMETSFIRNLGKTLRTNVRDYGMYIALAAIMLFFTVATGGKFFSPRNISDLINQMGYIAVIAVGMTLVIIIRHIDLSVGFLAGFIGAVAAICDGYRCWRLSLPMVSGNFAGAGARGCGWSP